MAVVVYQWEGRAKTPSVIMSTPRGRDEPMIKYPKTPRIPQADQTGWVKFQAVVSEKLDGANAGISFEDGQLTLQSRGHILEGGRREAQFELFKATSWSIFDKLQSALGDRYVLFGEWLYAKHRVFYDALPGYYMTYDVYDKEGGYFLSTPRRQALLEDIPLPEAPILHQGPFKKVNNFTQYIGPTPFKTKDWRETLKTDAEALGLGDPMSHTDDSDLMEGVYIKVEDSERVVGRMKLPRADFEKVRSDDSLWKRQIILPNKCAR